LARFNVDLVTENCDSPLNKYFFKGVPAPMAAALVLFPIVIHFEFPQLTFFSSPLFIIVNTTIVAFMAGSTIPTPCLKKMKFKSAYKQLALMFVAIMLIGLLVKTWLTAIFICCFYITTILIGWFYYYKFSRANKG
jgi:CDP-diacylglycerol--serine O-phosphatidyltransferase